MKAVIDTSSLLSLVRYYLPFDAKGELFDYIKHKIEIGEIIIVDKVLQECTYVAKGIILTKMEYLKDKDFLKNSNAPYKTDNLLAPAPAKFLRQVDNSFANVAVMNAKRITQAEYDNQKSSFLDNADMKQVILCMNIQHSKVDVILVTEETETSNDLKLFKKIPAICKMLDINTMALPTLIASYGGMDLNFAFRTPIVPGLPSAP